MKKIFNLCAVALLGGFVLASCDDDSTNEVATHGLQVLSAQTSFTARGGTQTITVAQTPVSVYTNDSWATASISGNSINVTASMNPERETRHATVVVKSSAQDSAIVNIDQDGMVVSFANTSISSNDDALTASYAIKHNLDVTVSTSASWMSALVDGDSLRVTYQENNTGNPRTGWIYYTSGNVTDSVSVMQYDIDKDLLGDYELLFYDSGWYYVNVQLYRWNQTSFRMRFTDDFMQDLNATIPVTIPDTSQPSFSIYNLAAMGSYTYNNTSYNEIMLVMASSGTSVYYFRVATVYATADWTVDDEGYSYYPFTFSNDSYEFYGLQIGLSTNGTYNGFTSAGRPVLMDFPYAELQKVSSDGSAAKASKKSAKGPHKLTQVPNRLSWKAPQKLPTADKAL